MKQAQVSWKKPLILAVTLTVLGGVAYWLEFKHKPKSEEKDESAKKLFVLKDRQISSIRIAEGKKSYTLHCLDIDAKLCKPGDNSKWELIEPSKMRGDDSNINALLSSINNLTSNETIDLKGETPEKHERLLKDYKLDEESRKTAGLKRVEISTNGGETFIVWLGDVHPMGDMQFAALGTGPKPDAVKFEPNKIFLIPTYFKNAIEHDLTHWRDKKLMSVASHKVRSLTLAGAHGQIQAIRKGNGWILKTKTKGKEEEFAGDIENVDNLLNAAVFLTAKSFPAEKKTDARGKQILASAKRVVSLTLQEETPAAPAPTASGTPAAQPVAPEPTTLFIYQRGTPPKPGKPAPAGYKLFATVSNHDPVYEIDAGVRERMDKDLKSLRLTKLITSLERFDTKRMKFEGKPVESGIELANVDGKWLIMPGKTEATVEKVQQTLDRISGNRIQGFVEGNAIPKGEADGLTVTLGDEKDPAKRRFTFWKAGDKFYGRDHANTRKEAYIIDVALRDALPWNKDFFVKVVPPAGASAKPNAAQDPHGHSHGDHED